MYDEDGNWIDDEGSDTTVVVDDGNQGGGDPGAGDPGDLPNDPNGANFTGTDQDGMIYEAGQIVGMDLGDGTWADLNGTIYDANGNAIDQVQPAQGSGLGDFFSKLFGGGGASGNSSLGNLAAAAAQKLAQAQAQGASAATLAALQRQLAAAQARAGQSSSTSPLLVAGLVGLGVYVLARNSRN